MSVAHVELPGLALPGDEVFARVADRIRRGGGAFGRVRDRLVEMAGFSDTAEVDVLDSVFGDHATINLYSAPTFLALTTAAVNENSTGSTLTEANYTGYARKSLAAVDMGAAAAGSKSNTAQQQFAACTAGSSVVIGWAVCTASSAGNVIVFGTCTSTTISTTQTPATVAVGGLTVTLD